MRTPYGWAGTVSELLSLPGQRLLEMLARHHGELYGQQPAGSQRDAWAEEVSILRASLRDLAIARPDATAWGAVLEFELLLEGGRRPDVVLHAGERIFVIEFKAAAAPPTGSIDQVVAYARDLAEYHGATHETPVEPILMLTQSERATSSPTGVTILGPVQLAALLATETKAGVPPPDLGAWLAAPYEPLPTLVEAARLIFQNEPLPRIRRAESAGIPEALEVLTRLCKEAERDSLRTLAFLSGVPGAGKTLAGLQLVYERLADDHNAVFLSGNGPLVQVLRDALKSKAFVQDLHAFVTTYGTVDRTPTHKIVVFDEAQRAWDRGYMEWKGRGTQSEPEVLVSVGERIDDWCSLVGLVGDGQEIHSGEEAGIDQWREALERVAEQPWLVAGPGRLADRFADFEYRSYDELDLTVSLRSRRAENLHAWVAALLEGRVGEAARLAPAIVDDGFPMYLTRDLAEAKDYIVGRYADEPERRFGILASSRAQTFLPRFGVRAEWTETKKVNFAHWYNRDRGEPRAGGNLEEVVTEFGCQGLELDMPLVAWGDDVRWSDGGWQVKLGRPRYPQADARQLRLNAYRVLLTRGRDGFVLFVPPTESMNETELVLLAAGVKPIPNGQAPS